MLISPEYQQQQQWLHENTKYGTASIKYAPLVTEIVNKLGIDHLLDYGCGKQMNLLKHLKSDHALKYQAYDPGVPELSSAPVPAQMVSCIDVLEHIEPDYLDAVLDDLKNLTEMVAFITVHCGPASKVLPDGRNAHLIQQPMEWWLPKLTARFELQTIQRTHAMAFHVIAYRIPVAIQNIDGTAASNDPQIVT